MKTVTTIARALLRFCLPALIAFPAAAQNWPYFIPPSAGDSFIGQSGTTYTATAGQSTLINTVVDQVMARQRNWVPSNTQPNQALIPPIPAHTTLCNTGASFTGAISGTTLSWIGGSGGLAIGQTLTGGGIASGTTITAGSGLLWTVSISQTVSSEPMKSASSATASSCVTTPGSSLIWQQMRTSYLQGRFNNPHYLGVMASPPTETLFTSIPVGYTQHLVQTANPGNNTGVAYITGGDPVNYFGGYKIPVVTVLTGGNVSTTANANVWRAKFIVDATAPVFNVLNSTAAYRFIVNGQYVETTGVTASNGGFGNWIQLTFSSRAVRTITVESTQATAIFAIGLLPNEAVYPAPAGLRVTVLGDSLTAGTLTGANLNQADGIMQVMCDGLGVSDCRLSGVGGTGVQNNAGNQATLIQRLQAANGFTVDAPASDLFILAMGTNDTSFSYASNVTAYVQAIGILQAQYPTTPIVVIGCPPENPGPVESSTTMDIAIQTAVAQVSSPYVVFIPNAARAPNAKTYGAGAVTKETSGAVTMTAAPTSATTATLTAGFPGPTGNYKIIFTGGSGSSKTIGLTKSSTAVTWTGAVTDSSATLDYQGLGGPLTLTASPVVGATTATLSAGFSSGGVNSTAYISFSSGEVRQATLTNASTAVSWTDALLLPASPYITWNDTTTFTGPSDIYFTTGSGFHPNSTGALAFGFDYDDAIYNAIRVR